MKPIIYVAAAALLSSSALLQPAHAAGSGDAVPAASATPPAPRMLHHRQAGGAAMQRQASGNTKSSLRGINARENAETEQLNQAQLAANGSAANSGGMGAPSGLEPQAAQAPNAR